MAGRMILSALLMQQALLTSSLQCFSNNGNSTTAFPSNTSKPVQCQQQHVCGAVLLMGIDNSYFKSDCGDNKSMPCNCMLTCLPSWVSSGEGSWTMIVNTEKLVGRTITKLCNSDYCNLACSKASQLTRFELVTIYAICLTLQIQILFR